MTGIYKIESKSHPDRCYIGSAVNFNNRRLKHLSALRKNNHHSLKLQNHYNKYSENDLIFSILICCDKEELINQEQFFLDSLKHWFNILPVAGSPLGYKYSLEVRMKVSKALKGIKRKPFSIETRAKMSAALKLRKCTEETKQKLREINIGKKYSDETKKKLSDSHKGNKYNLGRKLSEEHKRKIGEKSKGRIMPPKSDETIKKMSESHKNKTPWNKGKSGIYSELSLEKMRKSKLNNKYNVGRVSWAKDKKFTEAHKQRMKEGWRLRKLKAISFN